GERNPCGTASRARGPFRDDAPSSRASPTRRRRDLGRRGCRFRPAVDVWRLDGRCGRGRGPVPAPAVEPPGPAVEPPAGGPMSRDERVGAVLQALADPTRREVVSLLSQGGSVTATELAASLPVTRQAVSKHLAALTDAGLVASSREGREVRYRLTPSPM